MRGKATNLKKLKAKMEQSSSSGWKAMQKANFKQAERAYQAAAECARLAGDLPSAAVFLSYLAIARQKLGKYEQARADLESSLAIALDNGLDKVKAHASLLLGEQERAGGNNDSAVKHFLAALESSLSGQDQTGAEMAFGNLGLTYLEKGWAEQASECFRQALARSQESPNKAAWLGSLGQCLAELGQLDAAADCYRQSFNEARASDNIVAQAICRGSEGNTYFEKEDYERAAACYMEAFKLSQSSGDRARAGIWLGNLSNAFLKLGKQEKAVSTCKAALKIARSLGAAVAVAAHLDSLGDCYLQAGDLSSARASYEQALTLSQAIDDRAGQRIYLFNLGRVHKRLGQLEPAFNLFSRAIALFDDQRSRIKSDDLKTSFAARGQQLYRDMVDVCLCLGKRIEALEYAGRAKSRAILDLLSNSPIDVSELPAGDDHCLDKLVASEAQLRNQIIKLERIFWQPPAADAGSRGAVAGKESAARIYAQWRQTINQLRRRHPDYANLIAVDTLSFADCQLLWQGKEPEPELDPQLDLQKNSCAKESEELSVAERLDARKASGTSPERLYPIGQAYLKANTAIIEYYWTDEYFLAASICKGAAEPHLHVVRDSQMLSALKSDLSDFLVMSSTEGWEVPPSLCRRLYDHLVAPLVESLPQQVERLLIVPHATLYHLPFSALHDGKQFLIERYALSYLPATTLIPILGKRGAGRQAACRSPEYLVSAISDYSATRKQGQTLHGRLSAGSGLEDLGHTVDEARSVSEAGTAGGRLARLLTNDEVTASFSQLFSQYPVVHFAGHAIFNSKEPLASGLVLSDGSMLTAAAILQGNALRTNCGRLLVLSACQTGLNMVTAGGEIVGLARALMYAGMPNLLLSLWAVADRSTSSLMQDFHRAWAGGKSSIASALQAAQQQAIRERQPIHSWAPFIHVGIE